MGTVYLPKRPSAVYAPAHENTPQAAAATAPVAAPFTATRVLEEESGNILRYLKGKLPPEVFERLNDSLKEKVYGAVDRHYQELFGRYTASDDKDETAAFIYHTADEIAELLRSGGGAGQFNAGEIENSAGRNLNDLEIHANSLLRQKTDIGAFLDEESPGSIVKCVFRDNAQRPKTVTDLKLSINVPDSALISPVFYCYAAAKYLVKELICRHIIENIDRAVDASADQEIEQRIIGLLAEIVPPGLNLANVREHVRKSADIETIRTRGFNTAVNLLVSLLERANMDYQFIENAHNGRELVIREYEDSDEDHLPDERYQLRLRYFDREQLADECKIHDAQTRNFENEVQHLWDLIEVVYQDSKSVFKVNDFEDLAKKNKSRIRDLIRKKNGEAPYEISGETLAEKGSRSSGDIRYGDTCRALARMHERIKNMYDFLYPVERRVMEERLARLEKEYYRFDFTANPRHLQSGLLIDVDLTSIKRKKTTLDSLASILNEFLRRVPVGFHDAALAVFSGSPPAAVQADETGGKRRKATAPAKASPRKW